MIAVTSNAWATAIQRGFTLSLPIVMFAAFSTALGHLPLAWAQNHAINTIQAFFVTAGSASFGIISVFITITISYSLSQLRQQNGNSDLNPIVTPLIALLSFIAVILPPDGALKSSLLGMQSVLPAVLTALISTELFYYFCRKPSLVLYKIYNESDFVLSGLLRALIPAGLTIFCFFVFQLFAGLGGQHAAGFITLSIDQLFESIDSPIVRLFLFVLVSQILWFFGIHGNAVLSSVEKNYLVAATEENIARAGQGLPPLEEVTKPLLDVFVNIGGSGAILGLALAVIIGCRHRNHAHLAKISLIPAIFNISEILVFALPVVLNPIFLIPFIITPIVLVLTSYAAMSIGFITPISVAIPWTTPPVIGGYLANGNINGVILQCFNLFVAIAIYSPFVQHFKQEFSRARQQSFESIVREMEKLESIHTPRLTHRTDKIGSLSRQLSIELNDDLLSERLYLHYQPQLDAKGHVVGVEALLRWNHRIFNNIPPIIAVQIAEESDLIYPLGQRIFHLACQQLKTWQDDDINNITMSINLSPKQLNDPQLFTSIERSLEITGIKASDIELEITESMELGHDELSVSTLEQLAKMGFKIAMDDFSMGYSSLLYMRRITLNTIKLDGSLTRDAIRSQSACDIISAVATLCHSKGIKIVSEYVETQEQRDLLGYLGSDMFQGYLYSKAISGEACLDFIKENSLQHKQQTELKLTPSS